MPEVIRVNKNEATAARRRAYFYCVDASEGKNPVTGEAGGQPQVSIDGGSAFTDTGIGVLVAIGNGRYYAEVTQATVNADARVILTRYKSANTAEIPGSTLVVDKKIEDAAAQTGPGSDYCTLTIKDSSGNVVPDADVWIRTKDLSQFVAGTLQSDSQGKVGFWLDNGVEYAGYRQKDGINFTNPWIFTAVKD